MGYGSIFNTITHGKIPGSNSTFSQRQEGEFSKFIQELKEGVFELTTKKTDDAIALCKRLANEFNPSNLAIKNSTEEQTQRLRAELGSLQKAVNNSLIKLQEKKTAEAEIEIKDFHAFIVLNNTYDLIDKLNHTHSPAEMQHILQDYKAENRKLISGWHKGFVAVSAIIFAIAGIIGGAFLGLKAGTLAGNPAAGVAAGAAAGMVLGGTAGYKLAKCGIFRFTAINSNVSRIYNVAEDIVKNFAEEQLTQVELQPS